MLLFVAGRAPLHYGGAIKHYEAIINPARSAVYFICRWQVQPPSRSYWFLPRTSLQTIKTDSVGEKKEEKKDKVEFQPDLVS